MPPTRLGLARPTCSFCDNLSAPPDVEFTSELRHKFFHRECSTCEPRQDRILCGFCRHLRIRHLFFCDLAPDWQDDLAEMNIWYFDLNISPSHSCPFCQLLTHIIHLGKFYFPVIEEEINKGCGNAYLRLMWDPNIEQPRLGLCAGLAFYPVLLYEDFCGGETFKRQARNPEHYYEANNESSAPLHVGKKVRWDQVKLWLKECSNNHKMCLYERQELGDQLKRLPDGFMLIDVKERKIVYGDQGCQFVALSYVWGDKPDNKKLSATNETIGRLRRRNGVSAHELPATIEDAIQICIELGEQYLWVDRLCIVQDDEKTKQHQIDHMASIYASASLVIVVTEGDMESGVAGVRHERPTQDIQFVSGSTFSHGLPCIWDSIQHSRWATRGWTYQEAILASKKLFFTSNQVYYMCGSTIRSENFDTPTSHDPFTDTEMFMKLHYPLGHFDGWGQHLEAYTARNLRHSSDIYNAFIGICSALFNEDDPLLCGLPRHSFDQALLWSCTKPAEDAPPHQIRIPEKDEQLPSWSWSSVIGKVSLNGSGARELEFCGSLVEWAVKRSGDSHLERVWHPDNLRQRSLLFSPYPPQFYLAVAWSQGCLKKPWPFPPLCKHNFSSLIQFIKTRWTSVETFTRSIIWGWNKDLEEELLKEMLKNPWLQDKTLLVSCAQTAWFKLKKHRPHSMRRRLVGSANHYDLEVIDEDGRCIGMLAENEPRVKKEMWSSTELGTFEFVALSVSCYLSDNTALRCVLERNKKLRKDWEDMFDHRMPDYQEDEEPRGILWQRSRNLSFYDRSGFVLEPIPVVNVMLIERDLRHRHLVHRVTVGWILLAQWAKAERKFKTIILE